MTTPLDRMRAAWKSGGRLALHAEVESLAVAGTPHDALDDAVNALLLEARAAGADDETEEEIIGVGDRLSGWCHAARRITFPAPAAPLTTMNGHPATYG